MNLKEIKDHFAAWYTEKYGEVPKHPAWPNQMGFQNMCGRVANYLLQRQEGSSVRIEIYEGGKTKVNWKYRVVSVNGNIMASGSGYNTKQSVLKSIDSLKENLFDAPVVEVSEPILPVKTKK